MEFPRFSLALLLLVLLLLVLLGGANADGDTGGGGGHGHRSHRHLYHHHHQQQQQHPLRRHRHHGRPPAEQEMLLGTLGEEEAEAFMQPQMPPLEEEDEGYDYYGETGHTLEEEEYVPAR